MRRLLTTNLTARNSIKYLLCLPLLPADKITAGLDWVKTFLVENSLREEFEMLIRWVMDFTSFCFLFVPFMDPYVDMLTS